ncbi:hypothetical protein MCAG_04627 [Micromonospora sp. ATCC 39149]|uniref:Uncharacterized protein n=1 Tax=Micromonospora carbonacea TaxID=47853 RepID=A0A7D5YIC5_9ACTN|nr:hypothetical protein [Micromonospora sp. ATCC 39149]EEP74300.1 hypothetical protein MCAG_04627 [Micromonospora sp. ATCC 39149]QLK00137.1 hypothetical protein HZU44_08835 [Micromonospora carbonacea]
MRQGWGAAVAVAVAVVVVAVVVAGVAVRRSGSGQEPAAPPASVGDTGSSSTRLPSPDDSYWDPGRMGSAEPAPMPSD